MHPTRSLRRAAARLRSSVARAGGAQRLATIGVGGRGQPMQRTATDAERRRRPCHDAPSHPHGWHRWVLVMAVAVVVLLCTAGPTSPARAQPAPTTVTFSYTG